MPTPELPLIVEAADLEKQLGAENLLVVDLCTPGVYEENHIPGAVHLDYSAIVRNQPPVMGLLPDECQLSQVLSAIGLTPETHVVAYDNEGGGKASRLLWTLQLTGHKYMSLLNGGLHAWLDEHRPLSDETPEIRPTNYPLSYDKSLIAERQYILAHLDDEHVVVLDARSPGEYSGTDVRAQRGGHIPGAVNLEWTEAMDRARKLRLKPAADLRQMYQAIGVTPDKEIIAYCQTHHRSAFTFIVLQSLGYTRLKGYPGSWSDWGNDPETPIE